MRIRLTLFQQRALIVLLGAGLAALGKLLLDDASMTNLGLGMIATGAAALGAAVFKRPGDTPPPKRRVDGPDTIVAVLLTLSAASAAPAPACASSETDAVHQALDEVTRVGKPLGNTIKAACHGARDVGRISCRTSFVSQACHEDRTEGRPACKDEELAAARNCYGRLTTLLDAKCDPAIDAYETMRQLQWATRRSAKAAETCEHANRDPSYTLDCMATGISATGQMLRALDDTRAKWRKALPLVRRLQNGELP